jgi:hypothetical protein
MEVFTMARQSKREYLRSIYRRYRRARRAQKTAILEEFCKVCGYNRKYAIWLLSRPLPKAIGPRRTTPRSPTYSKAMVAILAKVWEACGYLCSQRLKAALPHWLCWIRKHFELRAQWEQQLVAISPRQMDRRLNPYKRTLKRRLYGITRPGSLLKQMIPVRTDHWDVRAAGYLEIDLVSHCGGSGAGEFIYTLDCVDIATCWVERKAVMGKGQSSIVSALSEIEQKLPFPLRGIDSDNGSEFINTHLLGFCQRRPKGQAIQFTRSRAYKKDDNAHIEQKNWTHVRKLLGWDRYDTVEALQAINPLYEELRIFQNLFQPSMKLSSKTRKGSRLLRHYDKPLTPFERVVQYPQGDCRKLSALRSMLNRTDPFELSRHIDQKLNSLYQLASQRDRAPRESPPLKEPRPNGGVPLNEHMPCSIPQNSSSPWREWTFSKKLKRQKQEMRQHMRAKASVRFSHDATKPTLG